MNAPLPWERLLWSSRPWRLTPWIAGERYVLTDFRLVRVTRKSTQEVALDDVADIRRVESRADRILGAHVSNVRTGGSPSAIAAASAARTRSIVAPSVNFPPCASRT